MKDSQLIEILKLLTYEEIKELDKAVDSPFFNTQPMVTDFYKLVRKYYPDFNNKNLTKEKIYSKLYPGKEFNGQRIRSLSSELKKIVDDYLLFKSVKNNPIKGSFIKVEELFNRGLIKELEKELKLINNNLETGDGVHEAYLRDKFYYENLNVQFYLRTEQQHLITDSSQEGFAFFLYHFFMRLAYFIHDISVNKIIFNNKAGSNLIEKITGSIDYKELHKFLINEKERNKYYKIVNIYILAIINNLEPKDLTYYEPLMAAVTESIDEFSRQEKYNIYQIIEAICWLKMANVNNEQYRKELFRINKMRLEDGVFSPDGKVMRLMLYRQILMTALYLREFDWTEKFINTYSLKLPVEYIKNMQNFSHAHISYEKGDYNTALGMLKKVDFDIFTLKFDTRNLLLKIYYELEFYEEAYSLVDSYRHFLAENKTVSEYYRNLTNEFLNFYNWLLKIKTGNDLTEINKFKESLGLKAVYFGNWMKEKAELIG